MKKRPTSEEPAMKVTKPSRPTLRLITSGNNTTEPARIRGPEQAWVSDPACPLFPELKNTPTQPVEVWPWAHLIQQEEDMDEPSEQTRGTTSKASLLREDQPHPSRSVVPISENPNQVAPKGWAQTLREQFAQSVLPGTDVSVGEAISYMQVHWRNLDPEHNSRVHDYARQMRRLGLDIVPLGRRADCPFDLQVENSHELQTGLPHLEPYLPILPSSFSVLEPR